MSIRYVIKDIEDIEISEDGKELEVLFDGDDFGNKYVDIPIEMIINRLGKLVTQPSEPTCEKFLISYFYIQNGNWGIGSCEYLKRLNDYNEIIAELKKGIKVDNKPVDKITIISIFKL